MDLQVQPMLQQFTDGMDVGVGYLTVLLLGLGHSWVGQPARFPSSLPPDEVSNTALASSLSVADSKERGQLSCSLTTRVRSTVLPI